MAGVRLTQLHPQRATGRRYGSFVGKTLGGSAGHPVGRLTQLHPQRATGRRYGSFVGRATSVLGPLVAGTVPVRYILTGETKNIVPVETVLIQEAGVVPIREFVGPANVVPVREAPLEVPRVKVRKV